MFDRIKIGAKITGLVITVVLISVFALSYIAFNLSKNSIEDRYRESIRIVARLKTQKIETFFEKIKANLRFGSQLKVIKNKLAEYSPSLSERISPRDSIAQLMATNIKKTSLTDTTNLPKQEDDPLSKFNQKIQETFLIENEDMEDVIQKAVENYGINNIYLTNKEGRIVYKTDNKNSKQNIGDDFNDPDGNTVSIGRDSVYFSNVYGKNLILASAPILDDDRSLLGVMIFEMDIADVINLAGDTVGLGKKGEIHLLKSIDNKVIYLNPTRHTNTEPSLQNKIVTEPSKVIQNAVTRGIVEEVGQYIDYRGERVLAVGRYIPVVNWGIVVKVDKSEILEPANRLFYRLATAGVLVFLISLVIGILFSRIYLVRPLIFLKETVNLLSKGVLPAKLNHQNRLAKDEIGEMTGKLNELVDNLKTTVNFARSIGKGEFQTNFKPISEKDVLGITLLSMRDNIQQSARRDDDRSWIVTGLAEIGDILPSIRTIDELGELVTEYVTNKIGAVQGAFYALNDEDLKNVFIEMKASYAYNKKKYLKGKFKFAEGLVGQAAAEKDTIVRTEIPDDYMSISSGILGDKKPKCILITPLITNETVYGVLEFAGFDKFANREIKFVEEISELIARTVFNIRVKENTERLLTESELKSRELQEQQEILRQNAEVMEATQEELQRTNKELENQIREVQRATDRTQLLLENASEVITIYEPDATIRYISPSVEKILGYNQEEMIGIRDIIYVHPEGVESYEQMFKDLLEKPDEKVTIQFSYKTKAGERIWLESTGTNLLSDPAIQGIVLNSRDITERRAAEKEQRLRGQMQALSENSPDLITRISKEGRVFYINPIIETYTGRNKELYIQKHLQELELSEGVLGSWSDIVKNVLTRNQKFNVEMDFPSIMGDRVMQVNAIPEYNDQNNMESVLVVSHDITERKVIELEISQKNRKITESINYAKRIQEAILPDTNYIRQFLKDSFILYKPRDVVSGDFPWFLQREDDIYIAAVDCTGHGVPGALISLIGFFLLNNIVNLQEAKTPGQILDMLDEDVTKTLKQDESDTSTKDGMDISLCKINQKKMQIEYAGAHRPLYFFSENELHEIKGNKFPIGGAQHKNRVKFTNTVINYKQGDALFLFSDGYPDQFGGPKNKKLSPRMIRDIIKENYGADLNQLNTILDDEFENWKGNNKQTDDVLFIGIKL